MFCEEIIKGTIEKGSVWLLRGGGHKLYFVTWTTIEGANVIDP